MDEVSPPEPTNESKVAPVLEALQDCSVVGSNNGWSKVLTSHRNVHSLHPPAAGKNQCWVLRTRFFYPEIVVGRPTWETGRKIIKRCHRNNPSPLSLYPRNFQRHNFLVASALAKVEKKQLFLGGLGRSLEINLPNWEICETLVGLLVHLCMFGNFPGSTNVLENPTNHWLAIIYLLHLGFWRNIMKYPWIPADFSWNARSKTKIKLLLEVGFFYNNEGNKVNDSSH